MKPMEQWIKERPLCVGWNDYDGAVLRWLNAIRSEALAERDKLVEAVRVLRETIARRSRVVVLDDTNVHRFATKHTLEWLRDDLDAILKEHG